MGCTASAHSQLNARLKLDFLAWHLRETVERSRGLRIFRYGGHGTENTKGYHILARAKWTAQNRLLVLPAAVLKRANGAGCTYNRECYIRSSGRRARKRVLYPAGERRAPQLEKEPLPPTIL